MTRRYFYNLTWVLLLAAVGLQVHHFRSPATSAGAPGVKISPPEPDQIQDRHASAVTASAVFHGNIAEYSSAEVQAALERLKDLPGTSQRSKTFEALIRRLAALDESGAMAYVESLNPGETKNQAMRILAEVLARADPQFLAAKLLANPDPESLRVLANAWSQTDVRGALAWAEQLPASSDKDDALLAIRSQWAARDPAGAAAQIAELPESSSAAGLIATTAAHWAMNDPAQALAWADTLPESEKALALSAAAGVWAQHDPVAAGDFVAQLPPGETQNQAARSVVSAWAAQDPQATAGWVLQFPAGDLQDQGIRVVVSAWNTVDSAGVQNWAINLPAGSTRDMAVKSYVESIAQQSPAQAAGLVGWIDDSVAQEQSMETIMRSWSEAAPESARQWLATLNISDVAKARFQSFLPVN